jgi:hypothetical protein
MNPLTRFGAIAALSAFAAWCAGCAQRHPPASAAQAPRAPSHSPVDDLLSAIDAGRSETGVGAKITGSDHVYDLPVFSAHGEDTHVIEREYVTAPFGGVMLLDLRSF